MAIVLLGERARTNYDRAAVSQLLQEALQGPADGERSGDGVTGGEGSSEEALLRANGSEAVPGDPGRAEEPSTEGAPSLVDATATHHERHEQLGDILQNMLVMAGKEPQMDGLMQQLGQQLGSTSAVGGHVGFVGTERARLPGLLFIHTHTHTHMHTHTRACHTRACRRAWR